MNVMLTKTQWTPEDLLALPDEDRYELVDGHLVERPDMGWKANWAAGELLVRLGTFSREHDLGRVWPSDTGYQCFPDKPKRVRKPDLSFLAKERLPTATTPDGYLRVVPDLAGEAISPNDYFDDVDERIEDFLRAGVRLVWVLSPATRTVQVYRADGTGQRLRAGDELSGEDVVPGFRCRVGDLFPPESEPAPTTG